MRIVDARQGGEISVFGVVMNLDGEALLRSGANTGTFVEAEFPGQSSRSQPWRLLTAIFLHAGLMHIVFNTWALVTIGPLIEHLYGPRKMFVLYLVTGVLSNVASLWWHGARLLQVGASGAIFGLIGVAAVYGMRRGDALGENLKRQMMTWAVYGVMMGFFLKADNAAHIGGFLAGAAAGFVVEDAGVRRGALPDRAWAIMAGLGAAAAVGSFALIALAWAQSA
jgi:rhomboid protease GluP